MESNNCNLYLKINLYVMRGLYKKLGKNLCAKFVFKEEKKKTTYTHFDEILGIDKQRFNRIMNQEGSNRISKEERGQLQKKFNIDERYFANDPEFVLNGNISIYEWAVFLEDKCSSLKFDRKFMAGLSRQQGESKNPKEIGEKIDDYITRWIKDCESNQIERGSVLHRVYWYFTQGVAYDGDISENINRNIMDLEKVSNSEWKELEDQALNNIIERLDQLQDKLKAVQSAKKYRLI